MYCDWMRYTSVCGRRYGRRCLKPLVQKFPAAAMAFLGVCGSAPSTSLHIVHASALSSLCLHDQTLSQHYHHRPLCDSTNDPHEHSLYVCAPLIFLLVSISFTHRRHDPFAAKTRRTNGYNIIQHHLARRRCRLLRSQYAPACQNSPRLGAQARGEEDWSGKGEEDLAEI